MPQWVGEAVEPATSGRAPSSIELRSDRHDATGGKASADPRGAGPATLDLALRAAGLGAAGPVRRPGLAGLFASGGPWATATRVSADGQLRVEYERFQRRGAPATLTLELASGLDRIGLDERLVADWTVEALYPQPLRMTSSDGVLWLDLAPGTGSSRLHLALRPDRLGTVDWRILRPGQPPLALSAFIYP